MMKQLLALFISTTCFAGFPPTTSKVSGDSSNITTFNYQFPNFTGTHTGVTIALGVNSTAGGGTGLSAPGTSANCLISNGTIWTSAACTNTGANKALSNLASTAVNADIIPDGDITRNLGALGFSWGQVWAAEIETDGSLNINTVNTSGANSAPISVASGVATTGSSGTMAFKSGNASGGNSGGITIASGNVTSGSSGGVTIGSGTASATKGAVIINKGGTAIFSASGSSYQLFDLSGNPSVHVSDRTLYDTAGNVNIDFGETGYSTILSQLRLLGSSSGYGGFSVAAAAGTNVWQLPTADGSAGQVLKTDGSHVLSFVSALTNPMDGTGQMIYGGASGVATKMVTGTSGQVPISAGTTVAFGTIPGNTTIFTAPVPTTFNSNVLESITGNTTSGSACIASPSSVAGIVAGAPIIDLLAPAVVPADTTVVGVGTSPCTAGQIKMSANAASTKTGDSFVVGGVYTVPTSPSPLYLEVIIAGGGGGGAGSGTANGTAALDGNITYIATTGGIHADGGAHGTRAATAPAGGATASCSTAATVQTMSGGYGQGGITTVASVGQAAGGAGAATPYIGATVPGGGGSADAPTAGQNGTGSGGGGGGITSASSGVTGAGGGSGAYAHCYITSLAASYAYMVGVGGAGGGAGTGGHTGSTGGNGVVTIIPHYTP